MRESNSRNNELDSHRIALPNVSDHTITWMPTSGPLRIRSPSCEAGVADLVAPKPPIPKSSSSRRRDRNCPILRTARMMVGEFDPSPAASRVASSADNSATVASALAASRREKRGAIPFVNDAANFSCEVWSFPSCKSTSREASDTRFPAGPAQMLRIVDARIESARSPSCPTIRTFCPPDRWKRMHIGSEIATGSPIHAGTPSAPKRLDTDRLAIQAFSGSHSSIVGATLPSNTIMRPGALSA